MSSRVLYAISGLSQKCCNSEKTLFLYGKCYLFEQHVAAGTIPGRFAKSAPNEGNTYISPPCFLAGLIYDVISFPRIKLRLGCESSQ